MMRGAVILSGLVIGLGLLVLAESARAQEEQEPAAIAEIGAAGAWSTRGGGSAYGPAFSMETTPIPDVLEVEGGTTPFQSRGQTEWDTDFLFKKPFTLTDTLEFMAGVGPQWSHVQSRPGLGNKGARDSYGAEVAGDFMFWPWAGRHIGLYAEPSYGWDFGHGHDQALSLSLGLLFPFP
jgi:hypothetical protein